MPRPPSVTVQDFLALLAEGRPVPASALLKELGVSRPVLGRLYREAGDQVLRIGRARGTAYAARASNDAGTSWPLWRMRADASIEELGTLYLLRGERFQFEPVGERPNLLAPVEEVPGHFPGLPWFLDDLRPQGFLGRSLAHRRGPSLGVPMDLNAWRLRDTLLAITRTGGTGFGDLLLGSEALEQALQELDSPSDLVSAEERAVRYPQWAEEVLAGEEVGSSPGGEQPKFTSTVINEDGRYATLVKFASSGQDKTVGRWADLLVCEALALSCLREAGLPAAKAELVRGGAFLCLEVRRFDRSPDCLGRLGFVSLQALYSAFVGGDGRDWSLSSDNLLSQRWIDSEAASRMKTLHWFGQFIGNNDMHGGNLAFHLTDSGPLQLAPVYDMLPMYLAPSRTGLLRPATPVALSAPTRTGQLEHIARAATIAKTFWEMVSTSEAIGSDEIRRVAEENLMVVARFAKRFSP
ncbi:MAG TPA: type II toxin-antitoxin system HipA family toxin YjjJ [Arenimonas sp.]|jgi:hypothetical protein|nr:type II toxin-antitoxin system HipA family toxin YjjJ [Arenimonas sp.]